MNEGKLRLSLPRPMPASNDCLPHAAMNLGAARGVGMQPTPGMVSIIIIEPQMGSWVVNRLDIDGGFVGDTWHGTREDALQTVRKEFNLELPES